MPDVGSKKRKNNEDRGPDKKKKKVLTKSTASSNPQSHTIKVSSIVQPQVSPPVVGTFFFLLDFIVLARSYPGVP